MEYVTPNNGEWLSSGGPIGDQQSLANDAWELLAANATDNGLLFDNQNTNGLLPVTLTPTSSFVQLEQSQGPFPLTNSHSNNNHSNDEVDTVDADGVDGVLPMDDINPLLPPVDISSLSIIATAVPSIVAHSTGPSSYHSNSIPATVPVVPSVVPVQQPFIAPHPHQPFQTTQSFGGAAAAVTSVAATAGRTSFMRLGGGGACSLCHSQKTRCCGQRPCQRCIKMDRADRCVDRPRQRPRPRKGTTTVTSILATKTMPSTTAATPIPTVVSVTSLESNHSKHTTMAQAAVATITTLASQNITASISSTGMVDDYGPPCHTQSQPYTPATQVMSPTTFSVVSPSPSSSPLSPNTVVTVQTPRGPLMMTAADSGGEGTPLVITSPSINNGVPYAIVDRGPRAATIATTIASRVADVHSPAFPPTTSTLVDITATALDTAVAAAAAASSQPSSSSSASPSSESSGTRKRARGNDNRGHNSNNDNGNNTTQSNATPSPHDWGSCQRDSTACSTMYTCPSNAELERKAAEVAAKYEPHPSGRPDIHRDTDRDFEAAMIAQSAWFLSQIELALTTRRVPATSR
jgi:hypothetical protein